MPRKPRQLSNTGIYHVMLRGADRRIIFADDEDCARFLQTLQSVKEKSNFQLFAYCLMGNHVHLLMRECDEPLGDVMKRVGCSYVYYYNRKYELRGHLFQDRFRSEKVEDDAYFLDVLRYIWQNPIHAGLCRDSMDYPWLGCSGIHPASDLLDELGELTDLDRDGLLKLVYQECAAEHLEDDGSGRMTDREAISKLLEAGVCTTVQEIGGWDKLRRDAAISAALDMGVSIRQLARLTGISKNTIARAAEK